MKLQCLRYLAVGCALAAPTVFGADLRIGIIGCDTSHCTAFTQLINDANDKNHVAGGKVVAAFKGGSQDIKESWSRVDNFARQLQEKYGVKMADSVEELCGEVDAVLLESVDGRPHLEQARPVFKAHKPVAGSLRDVIELDRLAKESKTPWFSSSAYRFYDGMVELKSTDVGAVRGAISYGPCELEPHHPDFFWYGIHATEALYTVMGTGCESVARVSTPNTDVATGIWPDGRVGTLRGLRNASTPHKVIVFGAKSVAEQKGDGDYAPLVREIMKFFQTSIAPVSNEETVEIYAFMEAADESKREGGKPVKLSEVMKKNGGRE